MVEAEGWVDEVLGVEMDEVVDEQGDDETVVARDEVEVVAVVEEKEEAEDKEVRVDEVEVVAVVVEEEAVEPVPVETEMVLTSTNVDVSVEATVVTDVEVKDEVPAKVVVGSATVDDD
ncbi:hypothetical protein HDU67_003770, partial [Dinochytrium kinnereticum]